MQLLEVSGAVRAIYWSLGVKWLMLIYYKKIVLIFVTYSSKI